MPRTSPLHRPRNLYLCRAVFAFLVMAWVVALGPAAAAPPPTPRPEARLPNTIRPLHYELELTIVPGREEYQGTVRIPLQIDAPARVVWLEASDLRIEGAEIVMARDRRPLPVRLVTGTEDLVGFATDAVLGPGRVTLTVRFAGRMESSRTRGIYRQSEVHQDAESDWYAYTSFEPRGARRAFPCFDEPTLKAPWHLVLHVRKDDVALGNAPMESEEDEPGGMKVVRFAETPPLPSDLVAFAVGPFDLVPGEVAGHHGTSFRLAVPRGHRSEAAYALGVTPRLVSLIEESIDIPHPYSKLDVVVTPRAPGAAGHPGLVVVGPTLALTQPGEDELRRRQSYAATAVRALTRAWFGGLVTVRSRKDSWLDEAMGSWLALKILDRLEPAWRFSLVALANLHGSVMTLDSAAAAQPLRPVDSEEGFDLVFNAESRPAKGGAILEMIEAWVGGEKFERFLHDYLTAHAYGSVTGEDFFQLLGEQVGADTAAAIRSLVYQPGVPLLSIEARCAPPAGPGGAGATSSQGEQAVPGSMPRLVVSQERLLPAGLQEKHALLWRIPVCVKYGADGEVRRACTVLGERQTELPLEPLGTLGALRPDACPAWVMAQENGHGYYRVRYTPAWLRQLGAAPGQLTLPERVVILGDMEAGVERGDLKQGEALAFVPAFLGADADLEVIDSTLGLVQVRPELLPSELVPRWARFLREAYGARARALGWRARPGESELETQARPRLLVLAALMGDDPLLQAEATKLVQRWLDDHKALQGNLVPAALAVAARRGDRALQERYLGAAKAVSEAASKATTTTTTTAGAVNERVERGPLLKAVGGFDDPALVRGALARTLAKGFDSADARHILAGVGENWRTRELAYGFIKQNFDVLVERLRPDDLVTLFELPGRFCDEGHRNDVASFFTPRAGRVEGGARVLAQSLESIDRCIAYQKQHLASVIEFLKKR